MSYLKTVICAAALLAQCMPAMAINKCTAADGQVSYQEAVCSSSEKGGAVEIKATAPSVSSAAAQWKARLNSAIATNRVIIGMTSAQAQSAWGAPTKINRSLSASGASEQWVYRRGGASDQYVYVTNGLVTGAN